MQKKNVFTKLKDCFLSQRELTTVPCRLFYYLLGRNPNLQSLVNVF